MHHAGSLNVVNCDLESVIGAVLVFRLGFAAPTPCAIEFHAFAPLEALPCV
jgi:hypothetical protein